MNYQKTNPFVATHFPVIFREEIRQGLTHTHNYIPSHPNSIMYLSFLCPLSSSLIFSTLCSLSFLVLFRIYKPKSIMLIPPFLYIYNHCQSYSMKDATRHDQDQSGGSKSVSDLIDIVLIAKYYLVRSAITSVMITDWGCAGSGWPGWE